MKLHLFYSMLVFLSVASIVPGPNNMLLISSGSCFGFKRSIQLIIGIILGMECMLLLIAYSIGSLITVYPMLNTLLRIIGSLYLLWLIYNIIKSNYQKNDKYQQIRLKPISFYQGYLLQFVNPSTWLMIIGTVTNFGIIGSAYINSITIISLSIGSINIISSLIWLLFGTLFYKVLNNSLSRKIFHTVIASLILYSILLIWYS